MRTTLDIPKELLLEAKRSIKAKTKTETVITGLKELIRKKKIQKLIEMSGKIPLDIDLDFARERNKSW